jgi:protein involved in polysaccharide export with SLBB domain
MPKMVVSVVMGGAMIFMGAATTDAADPIPSKLRAQFEQFLAEGHNIPVDLRAQFERFLIERHFAAFLSEREKKTPDTVVAATRQPPPIQTYARLAAAGPDFPIQETAIRPLMQAAPAKPDCVLPISAEPPTGTGKHFEIGDKLKLAFFENTEDAEKNKWGNAAGIGFQQHPELSGDYAIQDDGTVSVPVLGTFNVLDLTPTEVQNRMVEAFNKALGRKGFVTIIAIERPPVYVLGPVKTPGSYTYAPGMTVLHAITLAGGFPREDSAEPWQKMEKVRQTTKRYSTLESISELLARQAVLKAERDHSEPVAPSQLIDLVGPTKAMGMVAAEVNHRSAIVSARNARLQSAAEAVRAAQQEVDMLSTKSRSLDGMDANIRALKQRADGMEQLYSKGQLTNNLLIETKGRLADAERIRQDAIAQVAQAKIRLATAQQDQAKLEADTRGELETQIHNINQQIANESRENATSEGILGALQVQFSPPTAAITYEIVRQTVKGPMAYRANGMSTLIPGDLVRISTGNDVKSDPGLPTQPNNRSTTPASAAGCQ